MNVREEEPAAFEQNRLCGRGRGSRVNARGCSSASRLLLSVAVTPHDRVEDKASQRRSSRIACAAVTEAPGTARECSSASALSNDELGARALVLAGVRTRWSFSTVTSRPAAGRPDDS